MKQQSKKLTSQESRFIDRLRQQPELLARLESILELSRTQEGQVRKADEVEEDLVQAVRQLGREVMESWASGAEQEVSRQLKEQKKSVRKKTLKWYCLFGLVEVVERIWCDQSTTCLRVFAPQIGVTHRGVSRRLNRVLGDFGSERSFARAAAQVQEHYGFEISSSAVRKSTLDSTQAASALLDKQYARDYRLLPAQRADWVVAQADGSMVCTVTGGRRSSSRPRQWREMRRTVAQAQGESTTCYAATFGGVDQVGRSWGHCAHQVGRGLGSRIHCVADGAEWIRRQSQEVFGSQGRFLCDFFHVSEYLGQASATCRPHNPRQWQKTQQARLKRGAFSPPSLNRTLFSPVWELRIDPHLHSLHFHQALHAMIFSAADNRNPNSLASRMRRQRMGWFNQLLEPFDEPVRVLDIGGTVAFWEHNAPTLPKRCAFTLLNLESAPTDKLDNVRSVVGDARNTAFSDEEFDVVFSNSVIEHVGSLYDQLAMAREIMRTGKAYFVQTPNRYFPLEPHFLLPFWQFLPIWFRAALHRRSRLGWMQEETNPLRARADVEQIRLMNFREMKAVFSNAEIMREKLGPLTKSLVAMRKYER